MSIQRSEVKFEVKGKPSNAYVASPTSGGPGVLVLPSWFGLKPYFKQICDRLAEHGYIAIAPDYYNGRIGHTVDEAQALQEKAESDLDAMGALVKAAKDQLGPLRIRTGESFGTLGFSMGADWAVITAASEPDVTATVLFYGSYTGDFSRMKSGVLGHYAENDEYQTPHRTNSMVENLKAAGVEVTINTYPGTTHWFMEEDRPEYHPAAASLAWERTLEFLKQSLPGS